MKNGADVKLPSWGGYWCWDEKRQTVLMHTKDGSVLDIRDTQVVEYTMMNICSDEWVIADGTNCPLFGGENTFSFSEYLHRISKYSCCSTFFLRFVQIRQ